LKGAALHIAALMDCLESGRKNKSILRSNEEWTDLYEKVVTDPAFLVQEWSNREAKKYEHKRTFKDTQTLDRAAEILALAAFITPGN